MRNWKSFMIGVALCILLVLMTATAMASTVYAYSENGKSINVRTGPGRGYDAIISVAYGTKMELLDESNGWSHVQIGDVEGYIQSTFVTANAPTPKKTDATSSVRRNAWIYSSNGGNVYLRKEASRQSNALASLDWGTQVVVTETGSTWSRVEVNGIGGYIMTRYLTFTKPEATATPRPEATTITGTTMYITSSNGSPVRVRSTASTSGQILTSLPVGTKVTAYQKQNNWTWITDQTVEGWIMTRYLSAVKPEITPAPTAAPSATPTAAPVVTESATATGSAYVFSENGQNVRVRKSPSSSAEKLGSLPVGTRVDTYGTTGSWTHIRSGSLDGYMMTRYLSTQRVVVTATPAPDTSTKTAYVSTADGTGVHLRTGAGKSFSVITDLPVGTAVTVKGTQGSWSRVLSGRIEGYIMTRYLSDSQPQVTAAPTASPVEEWIPKAGTRVYLASSSSYQVRTRKGPGYSEASGPAYIVGTPATVESADTQWVRIHVGGDDSYYVPVTSLAKSGAAALPQSQGRVVVYLRSSEGAVTVRATKFDDGGFVGSYVSGTAVILVSQNVQEGWAYVRAGGSYGYIKISQFSR